MFLIFEENISTLRPVFVFLPLAQLKTNSKTNLHVRILYSVLYTSHPCVWVQDEAPVDSKTVSSTEDQASGDTLEPEHESPVLGTKQVPSPLV